MGTRGVIGFYKHGKGKITYNHFDSYPTELGKNILDEIKKFSIEQMNNIFGGIKLIEDEDKKPTKKEISEHEQFINTHVGGPIDNEKVKTYYQLLHGLQGTLKPYLSRKVKLMIDSEGFLKESLFCEWGYVINLDTEKLEIWQGFKESPQDNRYKETKEELKKESDWWNKERPNAKWKKEYYNCALIKEYPLKKLPTEKRFLNDMRKFD